MIDNKTVMQQAYRLGFLRCAGWAQRDDLFADVDSPAYKKDRQHDLSTIAQPVEPHDLQKRLEALDFYEDIAEHYAKCAISPESLRDWVAERMDMPVISQPVPPTDPDDLTIAYMSGLADGKKAAQEKENK